MAIVGGHVEISCLFLVFEVLHKDVVSLCLFTPIPHNDTRTSYDFSCISFRIELAQACPFTEFLVVVYLDEVDAVFSAKSLDKLHVRLFITVVGKNAQKCLSFVKCFDSFTKTTCHTIVNHSQLQYLLNGVEDVHRSC